MLHWVRFNILESPAVDHSCAQARSLEAVSSQLMAAQLAASVNSIGAVQIKLEKCAHDIGATLADMTISLYETIAADLLVDHKAKKAAAKDDVMAKLKAKPRKAKGRRTPRSKRPGVGDKRGRDGVVDALDVLGMGADDATAKDEQLAKKRRRRATAANPHAVSAKLAAGPAAAAAPDGLGDDSNDESAESDGDDLSDDDNGNNKKERKADLERSELQLAAVENIAKRSGPAGAARERTATRPRLSTPPGAAPMPMPVLHPPAAVVVPRHKEPKFRHFLREDQGYWRLAWTLHAICRIVKWQIGTWTCACRIPGHGSKCSRMFSGAQVARNGWSTADIEQQFHAWILEGEDLSDHTAHMRVSKPLCDSILAKYRE